jgi:hypothetical protein
MTIAVLPSLSEAFFSRLDRTECPVNSEPVIIADNKVTIMTWLKASFL